MADPLLCRRLTRAAGARQTARSGRADIVNIGVIAVALAAILIAGTYFRFVGLDWDQGYHLHPDERFLSQVESALRPVFSVEEYLDTLHSPLNPNNRGFNFFVYGDFPIVLVQYLASWLAQPENMLDTNVFGRALGRDYAAGYVIGRALSAGCDLAVIVLVFLLGRQLYGHWVGLLAAGLYGGTVLAIQQSHFFTVDACANLFLTAAFWFAARAIERARWSDEILFGASLGLGGASKISIFPAALLIALAVALRVGTQVRPLATESRDWLRRRLWREPTVRALLIRAGITLSVAGTVTILTFRVAQPYAFLPTHGSASRAAHPDAVERVLNNVLDIIAPQLNPDWTRQMREVNRAVSGNSDQAPNHQWANRRALLFPWTNMVRFGMGWPLGLVAWFGCAWGLWEIARGTHGATRHVLPVAWILLFFGWEGTQWVKCMRYLFPVYPLLAVVGAWALVTLVQRAHASRVSRQLPPWGGRTLISLSLLLVVLTGTYAWAYAFTRIYTRPHTRVAASAWIREHVPSDVTLTLATAQGTDTYQIGLPHSWKPRDARADDPVAPAISSTRLEAGRPNAFRFVLPRGGRLSELTLWHGLDPTPDSGRKSLHVAIAQEDDGNGVLTEQSLSAAFVGDGTRGFAQHLLLPAAQLDAEHPYYLILTPIDGALIFSGATIATEGIWDDDLPLPVSGSDAWDVQFHNYPLQMIWEDTRQKRARLQYIVEHADYIVISSNRFYDALSRNPLRWPMTLDYYRALFSGQLGFELVSEFASEPSLWGFEFNERSAEESFTVYDHPRVFVFRKAAGFSPQAVAAVLGRADLDKVVRRRADQVREAPVVLTLPTTLQTTRRSQSFATDVTMPPHTLAMP